MAKWLTSALVLALGMMVGLNAGTAADGKTPTISEVMKKSNNPRTGLRKDITDAVKAGAVDWDAVQEKTKELAELADALGKNTPPRGSKESWTKLSKEWAKGAKELDEAAKKKDTATVTSVQATLQRKCGSCHMAHQAEDQ